MGKFPYQTGSPGLNYECIEAVLNTKTIPTTHCLGSHKTAGAVNGDDLGIAGHVCCTSKDASYSHMIAHLLAHVSLIADL
jgi:hypothetical protein